MHPNDHFARRQFNPRFPNRKTVKIWNKLRMLPVQHFLFWLVVLVVVLSAHCIVAFHVLDNLNDPNYEYIDQLQHIRAYSNADLVWVIIQNSFIYCLVIVIAVYLAYFLLYELRIQASLLRNRFSNAHLNGWRYYIYLIFSIAITLLLTYPTKNVLERVLLSNNEIKLYGKVDYLPLFLVLTLLILCTSGISYSKELIDLYRSNNRKYRRAEIQHYKKVIWQLRPHFVFNTLSNIQALAEMNSPKVPHLIHDYANLYRFVLDYGDKGLVALEDAIKFLKGYLRIEELGLSRTARYQLSIPEIIPVEKLIPPLVLQVIAENCFKHYSKDTAGTGFITIELILDDKGLSLITSNTYRPRKAKDKGRKGKDKKSVGLKAITKQLDMIYGKKQYNLSTKGEKNIYKTILKLPLYDKKYLEINPD